MSQAQFTIPLITVIPGQLITAALWNNEWNNVGTNLNPLGIGGYEDTDAQMQIQTAPYPSSVTSHASSLGGDIERIRYQISAILGPTTPAYWYAAPPITLTAVASVVVPLGAVIDYHSATPPNNNWLLANGQAIGRSAYSGLNALYSAASYPFGAGDGSTTFNLPNYTDVMSIGSGNLYAAGSTGGSTSQTQTHSHVVNDHTHTLSNHIHPMEVDVGTNANDPNTGAPIRSRAGASNSAYAITPDFGGTNFWNIHNQTDTPNNNVSSPSSPGTNTANVTINTLNPYLAMYKMIRVL